LFPIFLFRKFVVVVDLNPASPFFLSSFGTLYVSGSAAIASREPTAAFMTSTLIYDYDWMEHGLFHGLLQAPGLQ